MDIGKFMKKHGLREGMEVGVECGKAVFNGTIVPSEEKDSLFLKLKSGYNTGIALPKITAVSVLGRGKNVGKAKVPAAGKVKRKPGLPDIAILHTGGTIASRVDYKTGGVYSAFSPEDLLTMVPELGEIANIRTGLVSEMMSEDMGFSDHARIAKAVAKEVKKGVKGVIVGHGTDTLGYTAAMLSFMLENVNVPVLVVGAQRSSDRGSTDAAMNLICAARFIANSDFAGVAVCMHEGSGDEYCAVLPGTKTRKMHTSRRDAFKAINSREIARVDYKTGKIEFVKKTGKPKGKFSLKDEVEKKVGLLKTYPGISTRLIDFFRTQKYKGLIIEGTGLGHTPIGKKDEFVRAIGKLVKAGCVVGMASQCLNGRVNDKVYTNLRKVAEQGVVYGEDMLPETAYVKLAWLLGNYKKDKAKEMFAENLRGEITRCTNPDVFEW